MKKFLYIIIFGVFLFASCSKNKTDDVIRLGILKGPVGIGLSHVASENNDGKTKAKYSVTISSLPDEIALGFLKGELDIISVPVNMAAILNAKSSNNVKLLAINTVDAIYLLSPKGETIKSVTDLKGKRIIAKGKGVIPDLILSALFEKNGMSDEYENIEWKNEPSEVIKEALLNDDAFIVLPEPFASLLMSKNPNYNISFSLTGEWRKAGFSSNIVISVVIANKEFASSHKKEIDLFLEDFKHSISLVKSDPSLTAERADRLGIADEKVVKTSLPRLGITAITGKEAKDILVPFFSVIYSLSPRFIGDAIPSDDFYE